MERDMGRSTVALVRCAIYHPNLVYEALGRGVELLGGLDLFISRGERLLLKPNLLTGADPGEAVTTHPTVLEGAVRLFRDGGATVCFGDSPGLDNPARAAERAGLMEAGVRGGARFVDFSSGSRLDGCEDGLVPSFPIAQPVHQCDGMINLPKMKTHQLTRITGAVKNLFGCIPGKRKALYHVQFQDVMAFCELLVELQLRLQPRLHIMDAIVAMEGNGPRSGDPRPMHVLILSEDPVAVDAAFCRMVAMDPAFVPTNTIGQRRGLGHFREDNVEFVGDDLKSFVDSDFKVIRKPVYSNASYAHYTIIKNAVLPRPVIDTDACIRCGRCVEACPVPDKAVRFEDGRREPPRYDYDLCIRCYCCQEMCPERAIERKTPLLGRILRLG
jgi:uncharacterized protein (DUF362 family)/NAD-dependent dihydropyrimidine dehydrogenase PreA subunit